MSSPTNSIKSSYVVIGLVGHIGVDFDFFIVPKRAKSNKG